MFDALFGAAPNSAADIKLTPGSKSLEADRSLACQEILRIIWNPNGPSHTHKDPPLVSILIQINLLQPFSSHIFQAHFNIILPSTPRSSKLFFSSGLPTSTPVNLYIKS